MIEGNSVEIPAKYLPNTRLERCRYTNLFSEQLSQHLLRFCLSLWTDYDLRFTSSMPKCSVVT